VNIVEQITGEIQLLGGRPNPVPLCRPQIPHGLPWKRTWVSSRKPGDQLPELWHGPHVHLTSFFPVTVQRLFVLYSPHHTTVQCRWYSLSAITMVWTQMRKYLYRGQDSAVCQAHGPCSPSSRATQH
jgi:hypothetical protein